MKLDIAPFAYREEACDGRRLVLRWEEPRDVHQVRLSLSENGRPPKRNEMKVYYWRCYWPKHRATAEDLARGATGRAGWKPRDDWFNGEWAPADAVVRVKGRSVSVAFAPLARREFPDLVDFNVRYRQTMAVRIDLLEGCAQARGVQVFTGSILKSRDIVVELGCGRDAPVKWEGRVEVYNGVLLEVAGPDAKGARLRIRVACANPGPLSYDRTIVTLRSDAVDFSFRPDDLDCGRPIWIADLGVLVSEAKQNLRYSPELAPSLRAGRCVYDAIAGEPEQSLSRAVREQPPKQPMHFIVGCEGARQRFGVAHNGDVFAHVGFIRRVPARETERLGWEGDAFALRFGWDDWLVSGRRIARGYLPLIEARYSRGALDVNLEAFATPLGQSTLAGPVDGDAAIVCMVRLTFVNNGDNALSVAQPFNFMTYSETHVSPISRNHATPTVLERLSVEGDLVWAGGQTKYLRMAVDTRGQGELVSGDEGLHYRLELPPAASHSIVLKVPFVCILSAEEVAAIQAKVFETEQAEALRYWEARAANASEIVTPEPDINDFYRSIITHILINDHREPGSDRLIGRVGSFHYGNFSNEAVMQIMELDRRGLHDEARRHYETYLHYQGTVGLPGNFQGKDGVFYGSGGYEHGDYNQHHGWVLWGLAEHYQFTGDREWLLKIADKLIAGCDWVIRERQSTRRYDASGAKALEHGFLPAGSLEDVIDFCYWLSTNALTYRGLKAAAAALKEAGHPDGERLVREADSYGEDLLAGFRESMIRCPVVALRDGTYVPHFPSRLYWRGRDFGWIREALEGAINLTTTVLEPQSQESTWILKDYEDNLYIDAPYCYPLEDFEAQWFSRGGFSMQPNLVYFPPPYLLRDQIEHFLRAFFNGFAACWRADIRAMTEHPLPGLSDWAGDHFKSSDESMAAMWLRMMFVQEDGDTLYLGLGIPRAWLASKEGVAIRNAATHFGPLSFEMRALDEGRLMVAEIEPPLRRAPERLVVRFRHPQKARMVDVMVNGQTVETFDAEKEWVILPGLREKTTVEARFR